VSESVAAVGTFDGIHLGHQRIIREVVTLASQRRGAGVVLALEPHPQTILRPDAGPRRRLTSTEEKRNLVLGLGADSFHVLEFTREVAAMSAEDFVCDMVVSRFQVGVLVMGHDQRLGAHRRGDAESLSRWGALRGLEIVSVDAVTVSTGGASGAVVSSTAIRDALVNGNVAQAADMLGRPYSFVGTVVRGEGRGGREVGYPTANLVPVLGEKLMPRDGVYAVRTTHEGWAWPGVANVGCRPTFGGDTPSVEVHMAGFAGPLYDRRLTVDFVARIRDERRFPGPAELGSQIAQDLRRAMDILGTKQEVHTCPSPRK
jgi:riboflavin kinase/FMN adenylyltransferase